MPQFSPDLSPADLRAVLRANANRIFRSFKHSDGKYEVLYTSARFGLIYALAKRHAPTVELYDEAQRAFDAVDRLCTQHRYSPDIHNAVIQNLGV